MFEFDFEYLEEEESPREKFQPGEVLRARNPAVMREEASLHSKVVATIETGRQVTVLLRCGRRLLLCAEHGSCEGWGSCEALDGTVLWQRVGDVGVKPNDSTSDVEIRRFREVDRSWLRIIEMQAFGTSEQCLELWLRDSAVAGSRTVVDVAQGASGRILGYCAYRFEGQLHAPWLHVLGLAVDRAHRRIGLGARLVQSALKMAEQQNARAALLHVRVENFRAQRLYWKLGFLRVAKVHGYYSDSDAWELLRELPAMSQWPLQGEEVMKLRAEGVPRAAAERALRWTSAMWMARDR